MKVSIRFFDDREVRAVWDDERAKWWFSVVDVVGVLNEEPDYTVSESIIVQLHPVTCDGTSSRTA